MMALRLPTVRRCACGELPFSWHGLPARALCRVAAEHMGKMPMPPNGLRRLAHFSFLSLMTVVLFAHGLRAQSTQPDHEQQMREELARRAALRGQGAPPIDDTARKRFLEVENFARLPNDEQNKGFDSFYKQGGDLGIPMECGRAASRVDGIRRAQRHGDRDDAS